MSSTHMRVFENFSSNRYFWWISCH